MSTRDIGHLFLRAGIVLALWIALTVLVQP